MKLLVFDIEGTLFRTHVRLPGTSIDSTIWQAIAKHLGTAAVDEEVETHRLWHEGKYRSYLDWMKATIQIHQRHGLSRESFGEIIASAEYNLGVREAIARIDRTRYTMAMISGGFRELAARVQRDLHIHHAFAACEYFFDNAGRLSSYNLLPCDFEGKIDFIMLMLRELGLDQDDWVFVGDGANDVPIARRARVSIGYRPHPKLREVVTHVIEDYSELNNLLQ